MANLGRLRHRIDAALAQSTGWGPVDIDATVRRWTRCEHVDPLPRQATQGVERPIWVFVDRTLWTRPFWREQVDLLYGLIRSYGERLVRPIEVRDGPSPGLLEKYAPDFAPLDLALAVSEFEPAEGWPRSGGGCRSIGCGRGRFRWWGGRRRRRGRMCGCRSVRRRRSMMS